MVQSYGEATSPICWGEANNFNFANMWEWWHQTYSKNVIYITVNIFCLRVDKFYLNYSCTHAHIYRVGVISKCKFISFTNTSLLTVSCMFLGVAGALTLLMLLKLSVQVEATSSVTGWYAERFDNLGSMEALDRFRCNFDLGALPTDFSW